MNSTNATIPESFFKYHAIIPITLGCAAIGIIISCVILTLVIFKKRLHTVTHMLICNTCVSSILYCVVQCNNYVFLGFVLWQTSDVSCRWRAYFAYMSVAAVVYSYLLQAISRFLFSVLSSKYRWVITFKMHLILILIQWIVVILIPLPTHLTNEVFFRPFSLCWVPKASILHSAYIYLTYYFIPIGVTVIIYIYIYIRIKRSQTMAITMIVVIRQNRDVEVLRNIMILFGIYILGGTPTLIYLVTSINFFYSTGIIFVSLAVVVEKIVTIIIDREIRHIVMNYLPCGKMRIMPI